MKNIRNELTHRQLENKYLTAMIDVLFWGVVLLLLLLSHFSHVQLCVTP